MSRRQKTTVSKIKESKEKARHINLNDQNYLGKKTKRNSEDPQANESTTNRNKHEPEQNPQTHKFKENKNIIYFDCAHYIKHKDIKRIFKKYGKIKNLQLTNNRRGWVKFSKNDPVQLAMKEKQITFHPYF